MVPKDMTMSMEELWRLTTFSAFIIMESGCLDFIIPTLGHYLFFLPWAIIFFLSLLKIYS